MVRVPVLDKDRLAPTSQVEVGGKPFPAVRPAPSTGLDDDGTGTQYIGSRCLEGQDERSFVDWP